MIFQLIFDPKAQLLRRLGRVLRVALRRVALGWVSCRRVPRLRWIALRRVTRRRITRLLPVCRVGVVPRGHGRVGWVRHRGGARGRVRGVTSGRARVRVGWGVSRAGRRCGGLSRGRTGVRVDCRRGWPGGRVVLPGRTLRLARGRWGGRGRRVMGRGRGRGLYLHGCHARGQVLHQLFLLRFAGEAEVGNLEMKKQD